MERKGEEEGGNVTCHLRDGPILSFKPWFKMRLGSARTLKEYSPRSHDG